MIRRLTFCIYRFFIWSTCMLSCFHWKDQQTKQEDCFMIITQKSKIDVCQYSSVFVYLFNIYVISCLITLIYYFLHVHLFLVLITIWFIKDLLRSWNSCPCFHFLLSNCEICKFFPIHVVIFRLWYQSWYMYQAVPYQSMWKLSDCVTKLTKVLQSSQKSDFDNRHVLWLLNKWY